MGKFLQLMGLQEVAEDKRVQAQQLTIEMLQDRLEESFSRLELSRENVGWQALRENYQDSFTREGLRTAAEDGKLMGVANPLIKRGREVRHAYVWGQGVTIDARDAQVNDYLQAFMDDEGNRQALFGAQARQQYEGALYDEGNYFFALFTDPLVGRVRVRTLPFDEIVTVVSSPNDRQTPWYYERRWTETALNAKGELETTEHAAYYPDIKYQPATRFKKIDGITVLWDTPVRHVKVNTVGNNKFGIGDSFAALPWALSHKGFLEDWALLMKALSKIAFTTSSKTAGQAQTKRAQLKGLAELPAGSSVNMGGDQKLEAVSKSGATIDAESSRPLATMVASALGLPVTILMADPGQTGARATAETLDLPTRLVYQARQQLHSEVLRDLLGYALEQAVIAPRGALRGMGKPVRDGDRLLVAFNDPDDTSVNVSWPSLEQHDVKTMVDAIVAADGMPDVPKLPLIRAVLQVLKIDDIDELIDAITDADGKLVPADVNAGDVATKAHRNGEDPAEATK